MARKSVVVTAPNARNRVQPDPHQSAGLTIHHSPIENLRLDPLNPRRHSEKQVRQIANSIRTFGFIVPILIDPHGNVIAGAGRFLASLAVGMTEVPTISVGHLSTHQVRAFMIADNKLTENSSWDNALLGEQLKALSEVELDFELEATGFEIGEIDVLIEGLSPALESESDPADVLPEAAPIPVTRADDLWLLGRHRILCSNSLNAGSYSILMEGRRAAMVFTDPPYNVRSTDMLLASALFGTEISKWRPAR
jgi:ParB-like chromosome segregation protein Spo0J